MVSRQPPRPVRRGRESVLRRRYALQAGQENLFRHARCNRPTAAHARWNEGVLLTASDGIGRLAPDAEVKRADADSLASDCTAADSAREHASLNVTRELHSDVNALGFADPPGFV